MNSRRWKIAPWHLIYAPSVTILNRSNHSWKPHRRYYVRCLHTCGCGCVNRLRMKRSRRTLAMQLTRRWADDVSRFNKSIASLAFHRALLRAREEGHIDHEEWDLAMVHLGEQASCYGWDYEHRRRSAWVGICVCRDWSILEGRLETIGEPTPVSISLTDMLYGPDRILLQQLASRWKDLRSKFGDALLARLSGTRTRESQQSGVVWDALALVAAQDTTLQQQLENAVADDPDLLRLNGVLVWFVTRGSTSADSVSDALVSYLQNGDFPSRDPH